MFRVRLRVSLFPCTPLLIPSVLIGIVNYLQEKTFATELEARQWGTWTFPSSMGHNSLLTTDFLQGLTKGHKKQQTHLKV